MTRERLERLAREHRANAAELRSSADVITVPDHADYAARLRERAEEAEAIAALCEREAWACGAESLRWGWGATVSQRTGLPRASVQLSHGDGVEYVIARAIGETSESTTQGARAAAIDGAIATLLATVREMEQQRGELEGA